MSVKIAIFDSLRMSSRQIIFKPSQLIHKLDLTDFESWNYTLVLISLHEI